jgi:hypothetical protein
MTRTGAEGIRSTPAYRRTTALVASAMGVLLALAGFEHGLFEALQGSRWTGGAFIQAIGPAIRWWKHGGEDAFTVVPNFLVTGLASMSISLLIVIWSLFRVRRGRGRTVFLLLFIGLTLVGGGIGFIPFYLVTWAYASRIDKPPSGRRRVLGRKTGRLLTRTWPFSLGAVAVCWLIAIEIAIWGYVPGQNDPETILGVDWVFLLAAMVFINLSFMAASARDSEHHALAVERR